MPEKRSAHFIATRRAARSPRDAPDLDPRMNSPSRAPAGARASSDSAAARVRWFPMASPSPPPAIFPRGSGSSVGWCPPHHNPNQTFKAASTFSSVAASHTVRRRINCTSGTVPID